MLTMDGFVFQDFIEWNEVTQCIDCQTKAMHLCVFDAPPANRWLMSISLVFITIWTIMDRFRDIYTNLLDVSDKQPLEGAIALFHPHVIELLLKICHNTIGPKTTQVVFFNNQFKPAWLSMYTFIMLRQKPFMIYMPMHETLGSTNGSEPLWNNSEYTFKYATAILHAHLTFLEEAFVLIQPYKTKHKEGSVSLLKTKNNGDTNLQISLGLKVTNVTVTTNPLATTTRIQSTASNIVGQNLTDSLNALDGNWILHSDSGTPLPLSNCNDDL